MIGESTDDYVILVDGSSFIFRAFHGMPALTATDGSPTGALVGFLNQLGALRKEWPTAKIIIAMDPKGDTIRSEWYDGYKAERSATPDELRQQIAIWKQMIAMSPLPSICIDGEEADDVIGTLARAFDDGKTQIVIASGDKDLAQLVKPNVIWFDPGRKVRLDNAGVQDYFGVRANQIAELLALEGDKVDGIPGVAGVGRKTATKWLNEFETLDGVGKAAESGQISGKAGEKVAAAYSSGELDLWLQLTTIRDSLDIDEQLYQRQSEDPEQLRTLLASKGIDSPRYREVLGVDIADSVGVDGTADQSPNLPNLPDLDTTPLHQCNSLDELQEQLRAVPAMTDVVVWAVAEDLEDAYTDLAALVVKPVSAGGFYLWLNRQQLQSNIERLQDIFSYLQDTADKVWIPHLKNMMLLAYRLDLTVPNKAVDPLVAAYVLRADLGVPSLKKLATLLGQEALPEEPILGKGSKKLPLSGVDPEQSYALIQNRTALLDAWIVDGAQQLNSEQTLLHVFESQDNPLISVLSMMEHTGVRLDAPTLATQSEHLAQRVDELQQVCWQQAGVEFNIDSAAQVGSVLFDELSMPILQKTPKGQPSTSEDVLQQLVSRGYELPATILQYRSVRRLKGTYTDALPEFIDSRTSRVHPKWQQMHTASGRLSAVEPAVQTIPVRTAEGRKIRNAFTAAPGHSLIAADYSQIELRVMAHLSEDKTMIDAFERGLDIHTATASKVFSVPLEDVSSDQRRRAKAVNFGLIYGQTPFGLAAELKVTQKEAKGFIEAYFREYPGVAAYMEAALESAKSHGKAYSDFGRSLLLPELKSSNRGRRGHAERVAINMPVQGTAADIMKLAMLKVQSALQQELPSQVKLVMQVHDELVLEVEDDCVQSAAKLLTKHMTECCSLSVPLEVDTGVGPSWGELKDTKVE